MNKPKVLYNFLSFLFVISLFLIFIGVIGKNIPCLVLSIIYFVVYTILVLILGFKKAEKKSHKISMVIGSIILVGIMPFIYYTTYLKKILKKEEQISEIKSKVIEEMRLSGEIPKNNRYSNDSSTQQ